MESDMWCLLRWPAIALYLASVSCTMSLATEHPLRGEAAQFYTPSFAEFHADGTSTSTRKGRIVTLDSRSI